MKLKKFGLIIGALMLALGLQSCQENIIDNGGNESKAIRFGNVSSRASIESPSDILSFGVWAQMNLGADGTEKSKEFISLLENEKVSRATSSDAFDYVNTRYWVEDRTFRFFAVVPQPTGEVDVDEGTTANGVKYNIYKVPYTTSNNASYAGDMMVAHKVEKTVAGAPFPASVTLDYDKHALAKVTFNVYKHKDNEEDEIRIDEIQLSGVAKSGTFTTSISDNIVDSWTIGNDKTYSRMTLGTNAQVHNTGNPQPVVAEFLMLPQSVSGITARIKYYYKNGVSEKEEFTRETTGTIPAEIINSWSSNTQVVYNVIVNVDNNIQFSTPVIEPWGVPQSGGTVIIK